MRLIFLYGPVASGKLTVARLVAERMGLALFHNHLVVDAVAAVFPFGSETFMRLRERFWLDTFAGAAAEKRSLIFTFAPEPTVSQDFASKARSLVESAGGSVRFIALDVSPQEQERRVSAPSRGAFGKLQSAEMLRELRTGMEASMATMPAPDLRIDTEVMSPAEAADAICRLLARAPAA